MIKKFLSAGLVALACLTASATTFVANAPNGDRVVAYSDKACPAPIMALIAKATNAPAEITQGFRLADATIGGQHFVACWLQVGDGVAVMFEDGDTGMIPVSEFQKLKEV